MACHWAYDTRGNKVVYGVIITFMLVGKILIAAGIIGGYAYQNCFKGYRDCIDRGNDSATCTKAQEYCKMPLWMDLIVSGVIVWLFGVSFTAYMCCFSNPPRTQRPQAMVVDMQPLPAPARAPSRAYPPWPQGAVPSQVMGVPVTGYPACGAPPLFLTATVSQDWRHQPTQHPTAGQAGGTGQAGTSSQHPSVNITVGMEPGAAAWK